MGILWSVIKPAGAPLGFVFRETLVGEVDVGLPRGELGVSGDEGGELVDFVAAALEAPDPGAELYGGEVRDVEFAEVESRFFDEGGDEREGEVAEFRDHDVVAVTDVFGDEVEVVIVFIDVGGE